MGTLAPKPHRDERVFGVYIGPSLKFGTYAGVLGLAVGGSIGMFRSSTPVLFASASGLQSAGIGTVFWMTRTGILRHASERAQSDPSAKIKASTLAGATTGCLLAFAQRSPRSAIPGVLIFSTLGFAGQKLFEKIDTDRTARFADVDGPTDEVANPQLKGWWGFVDRLAASKWFPLKRMSDAEYETHLQERLIAVEAEIAVIDDRIEEIRGKANAQLQAKDEEVSKQQ